MPGPGRIEERFKSPWMLSALLYNFEIDSAQLKPAHTDWLKTTVQPYYLYSRSMQTVITGMASRTADDEWNYRLSKGRAASVDSFIFRMDLRRPRVLSHHLFAVGEEAAMLAGQANDVEDERYRGVILQVFDSAKVPRMPPPPPPPIKVKRRVSVLHLLTERDVGIPRSSADATGDRIAEGSRLLLQTLRGSTPVTETEQEIDQTWTVTAVSLTTSTLDATVKGQVGNVSEWLTIDYRWGPMKKGQERFLVKNGRTLRSIDFAEMSDWYENGLKTYRRYFSQ